MKLGNFDIFSSFDKAPKGALRTFVAFEHGTTIDDYVISLGSWQMIASRVSGRRSDSITADAPALINDRAALRVVPMDR